MSVVPLGANSIVLDPLQMELGMQNVEAQMGSGKHFCIISDITVLWRTGQLLLVMMF